MVLRKIQMILFAMLLSIALFSCSNDDPIEDLVTDSDQTTQDNAVSDDEVADNQAVDDEVSDEVEDNQVVDEAVNDEASDSQVDEMSDVDSETTDEETSSNLNTGDTSGQQAAAGDPGFACTKDGDCNDWAGTGNDDSQLAICILPGEGYPDGYCSFMCDSSVALNYGCNGYNGVYYGYGTYGDGNCFHPCDDPNDCRVGYRCSQTVGACMPDCAVDACQSGTCDEEEKVCL